MKHPKVHLGHGRTIPLRVPSLGRFSRRSLLLGGALAASLGSLGSLGSLALETSVRCETSGAPATSQDLTLKGSWFCFMIV